MPQQVRTTMAAVLAAVRVRLQSVTGLPAEKVLPDARDDDESEPPTKADQYILLRVEAGAIDTAAFEGAGRRNTVMERTVVCTLWTRMIRDEARSDESWLSDSTLGHLVLEHKVWDALAGFQPLDSGGRWLLTKPIVPRAVNVPRKAKRLKGWGRSGVRFSVSYVLDLDQTYEVAG